VNPMNAESKEGEVELLEVGVAGLGATSHEKNLKITEHMTTSGHMLSYFRIFLTNVDPPVSPGPTTATSKFSTTRICHSRTTSMACLTMALSWQHGSQYEDRRHGRCH